MANGKILNEVYRLIWLQWMEEFGNKITELPFAEWLQTKKEEAL